MTTCHKCEVGEKLKFSSRGPFSQAEPAPLSKKGKVCVFCMMQFSMKMLMESKQFFKLLYERLASCVVPNIKLTFVTLWLQREPNKYIWYLYWEGEKLVPRIFPPRQHLPPCVKAAFYYLAPEQFLLLSPSMFAL